MPATVEHYHVSSTYFGRKMIGCHPEIVAEIERSAVTVALQGAAAGLRSRLLPAGRGDYAP
jgi:hypothetical protein